MQHIGENQSKNKNLIGFSILKNKADMLKTRNDEYKSTPIKNEIYFVSKSFKSYLFSKKINLFNTSNQNIKQC